jgi:hypothetical protein
MTNTLGEGIEFGESDWENLLQRIKEKECTPFIGAGACAKTLPLGSEIARQWAKEYEYPLTDSGNLAQVAQFLAVSKDPIFPKQIIRRQFREIDPPDCSAADEPHGVLADLNLPIYITTNYDSFMFHALKNRGKEPQREFCQWNDLVGLIEPSVLDSGFNPTSATPLVYHLHGHYEVPQSMVLTEDDYLAFLVRLSKDEDDRLLPADIRIALATTSLLFVGYSLADWSFRVLFRGLIGSMGGTLGATSIAVQLDPPAADPSEQGRVRARRYLDQYFEKIQTIKVRIYWGDVREFAQKLRERWRLLDAN